MRSARGRACAAPRRAIPPALALVLGVTACGGGDGNAALHACSAEGLCSQMAREMSAATCPSGSTAIASCPTASAVAYCTLTSSTMYVYDGSLVSDLLDVCASNDGEWHGSTTPSTPTTPTDAVLKCRDLCYANALVCQAGCDAGVTDCQLRCMQDKDRCIADCG